MKKVAFPTDDGETIGRHLGQAQFYLVATLGDSGEVRFEPRQKPHHSAAEAHRPGAHPSGKGEGQAMLGAIADCQVLISGGMGQRAYEHALAQGLEVLLPAEKDIRAALDAYRAGRLTSDLRRVHQG